jgi:ribosomal protein S18 acetylase RimI-like enzyme
LRTKSKAPNLVELTQDFSFIEAGELTYWSSGFSPEFVNSPPSISYFPAKDHLEEFMHVISNSFQSYRNHYSYNPLFDEYSAREAYVDWGQSRAISSQEDQFAGVMKFNESPVGAISGSRVGNNIEIELAGIHSDFQGRGLYVNLIGEFWGSIDKGPDARLVISTQVENVNVQSAWQKMNFKKEFSVHTTHLVRKSLLN